VSLQEIKKEAERLYEDTLYTEQQHFIAAKWWMRCHYSLGLVATIAGVLATRNAVSSAVQVDQPWIAPSIVTVIGAVIAFLRPDGKSELHHDKGVRYNDLRRKLRVFIKIILPETDPNTDNTNTIDKLNFFEDLKTSLNREKPIVPSGLIYFLAKREIEKGHTRHVVDE
jgi:hypothetical protein